MAKVTQHKVKLPSFLASALINGDTSGLEERDMPALEAAYKIASDLKGHYVDVGDDSFSWGTYDLPGYARRGGDYAEFTINVYESNKE